jgi:hypothetical protein
VSIKDFGKRGGGLDEMISWLQCISGVSAWIHTQLYMSAKRCYTAYALSNLVVFVVDSFLSCLSCPLVPNPAPNYISNF